MRGGIGTSVGEGVSGGHALLRCWDLRGVGVGLRGDGCG